MHDPDLLLIAVYALAGVAVIEAAALAFVWAALMGGADPQSPGGR